MKRYSLLIILCALTILSSCKKEKERYSVDATLDPYLQLFLEEGKKRGITLDVVNDGLIMEFTQLQSPTIGLCTYQDPILVQIDKDYWEETKQYENQENLRQDVVFHELAHGLLNRGHDNSYLPNLEWKTLMCGGDEVTGRDWAVNFNGYRKEYYLDELFNTRTAAPDWSQPADFQEEKGNLIAKLDLSREQESIDKDGRKHVIKNNIYSISSNSTENDFIPLSGDIYLTNDFHFEVEMKYNDKGEAGFMGIVAMYDYNRDGRYYRAQRTESNPINDGSNYVAIHPTQHGDEIYLVNSNCGLPLAEILDYNLFNQSDYNKYAISRHDDELFFYLNDRLVFRNDYQANLPYIILGLILPSQNTVEVKSAEIYESGSGLRAGKEVELYNPCNARGACDHATPLTKLYYYRK